MIMTSEGDEDIIFSYASALHTNKVAAVPVPHHDGKIISTQLDGLVVYSSHHYGQSDIGHTRTRSVIDTTHGVTLLYTYVPEPSVSTTFTSQSSDIQTILGYETTLVVVTDDEAGQSFTKSIVEHDDFEEVGTL